MKNIFYIILLCILPMVAVAQNTVTSQVEVTNKTYSINEDGNLLIGFDIVIPPSARLSSNRFITLTPVLQAADGASSEILPSVYVYGRKREIIEARNHDLSKNAYKIIRRKNGKLQAVNYLARTPYSEWMNGANLEMLMETNGCANCTKSEDEMPLLTLMTSRYEVQPAIAFVTPMIEAVKNRSEEGKAFLDFPVNQVKIYPDYRRNPQELAAIRQTIDLVKNDKNTTITNITITGYASPEGSYTNNARLAQGRAEALKKYVLSLYDIDNKLFKVSSVPEDWAGLRKYVENSNLPQKAEILAIIDSESENYDKKEALIQKIDNGKPFGILYSECYPALRHSDYVVNYTVREFSVEEAIEILYSRPQQLSLEEMYRVAQTYENGSDEFNNVFDVAVRMFPADPIANLNASAIELQRGNTQQAQRYLDKSNFSNAAYLNNKGVIELLEGNLDAAEACFIAARDKGSIEAVANLEEISKKRIDNNKFGNK